MPDSVRSLPAADRNLLFGVLALQMDFIDRDALVKAMNAWVLDGAQLDLCEGTLSQLAVELDTLAGRLDLMLDRLAGAADPVGVCR
jgi:hypothetical protein